MNKQLYRFIVVGTAGFIIDVAILSVIVHGFGVSPYWARIPSFSLAIASTWYLNYHWAFCYKGMESKLLNFFNYFVVQSLGIAINVSIYSALMYFSLYFLHYPEVALAIASLVALFFNYAGLSRWVFESKSLP